MAIEADRLSIERKDRQNYDKIRDEDFFTQNNRNKDLFLFAVAVGVYYNESKELDTKEGYILEDRLSQEDHALLKAVALYHTEEIEVLKNQQQIFKIAEEYANAGLQLIIDKLESAQYGDFNRRMEADLNEIVALLDNSDQS